MIRKLVLASLLFISSFAYAQDNLAKIQLKNGSVLVGKIKSISPIDGVVISIAGLDSKIAMDQITSISDNNTGKILDSSASSKTSTSKLKYGDYSITDNSEYPDSIIINIGEEKMVFRLIRGGKFNMGYDGRHSMSYNSEPIHEVEISSFYVAENLLTASQAKFINGKKVKKISTSPENVRHWKDAKELTDKLQPIIKTSVCMITEAQWEYLAIQPNYSYLFAPKAGEWCLDFYSEYINIKQRDPMGPSKGRRHVLRFYSKGDSKKWKRTYFTTGPELSRIGVRLVINIKDINNNE